MMFLSIILIGIGITMFFKPDVIWVITESWKTENQYGPSDLYKVSTKFGGIMFFLVGLANLIVTFVFK